MKYVIHSPHLCQNGPIHQQISNPICPHMDLCDNNYVIDRSLALKCSNFNCNFCLLDEAIKYHADTKVRVNLMSQ